MTGTADRGPLDALGDGAWRVRQAAAAALARAELAEDTVHALLEGLRTGHRDLGLLNSTLQVLARTPADVTPALSACLAEADAAVRTYAAQALGDRGDPRAVPALLRALSDPDTNVRTHAIEALGKLRAGAAVDDLADLATSGDFAVAFPALDALAAIGDGRIAYRLTPLLRDPLVQEAAADALGRLGDEEAVGPLTALLDDPNAPVGAVARALAALQDGQERRYGRGRYLARLAARALTALGLANLIGAVEGAGRADAAALARVLGWAACPAADRALIRLLALPEARREAVAGLVARGRVVSALLAQALQAEDAGVRKAAVEAVGRIGDPARVPDLLPLLAGDAEQVAAVAGALAQTGAPAGYRPLTELLGHPNPLARQAVIAAINSIAHPDRPADLAARLADPDPLVRAAAVQIACYLGCPECADGILACCRDGAEAVRRAALEHLPYLEDARVLPTLTHALAADTPGARGAAIRALGELPGAEALPLLETALGDPDPWVRYFAARTLVKHRPHAPGFAVLRRLAQEDPAMQVRIAAAEALGGAGAAAVPALADLARSPEPDLAQAALLALGRTHCPAALPPLLAALEGAAAAVRGTAVRALGLWGRAEAVAALHGAAADPEPEVARAAIAALGRLETPAAVAALLALAERPARREACQLALADLGAGRAEWLAPGLDHPQADVRRLVVGTLALLRDRAAAGLLAEKFHDPDPGVRFAALTALAQAGPQA